MVGQRGHVHRHRCHGDKTSPPCQSRTTLSRTVEARLCLRPMAIIYVAGGAFQNVGIAVEYRAEQFDPAPFFRGRSSALCGGEVFSTRIREINTDGTRIRPASAT